MSLLTCNGLRSGGRKSIKQQLCCTQSFLRKIQTVLRASPIDTIFMHAVFSRKSSECATSKRVTRGKCLFGTFPFGQASIQFSPTAGDTRAHVCTTIMCKEALLQSTSSTTLQFAMVHDYRRHFIRGSEGWGEEGWGGVLGRGGGRVEANERA